MSMFSFVYITVFAVSLNQVLKDKDFETIQQPCIVCMSKNLILLSLGCLFIGAEAFDLLAPRNVWVISGVMMLAISGFMFGIYFAWETKKMFLAWLQMAYVFAITVNFYTWWY